MPTLGPGSQVYLKRTIEDMQPVVRTSKPYPLEVAEKIAIQVPVLSGGTNNRMPYNLNQIEVGIPALESGSFSDLVIAYAVGQEAITVQSALLDSGTLSSILIPYRDSGELDVNPPQLVSGEFSMVTIRYTATIETIDLGGITLVGGEHVR